MAIKEVILWKKIVSDRTIYFYDDKNSLVMYIDHSFDDCIWYFYSNDVINITSDMELYNMLNDFIISVYQSLLEKIKY